MGVLVDDLLLLARLDQGRPLEREPFDLAVVASEAVESAAAIDPDRTIELVADDPVRFCQQPSLRFEPATLSEFNMPSLLALNARKMFVMKSAGSRNFP